MISIVIPVYNAEPFLPRCVESFLVQDFPDFELILVEDGSTDQSLNICRHYEGIDSRIHVIPQENQGASAARNTGMTAAKGEFLMFADADDYVKPELLTTLHKKQNDEDADLLIFGYENISPTKKEIITFPYLEIQSLEKLEKFFPTLFLKYAFHSLCNKLYRKEKIHCKLNPGLSLGEDLTFNLVYLQQCTKIVFLDKALYCYTHENQQSLTQKYRENKFELALYCYHTACDFSRAAFSSSYIPRAENSLLIGDVTRCIQRLVQSGGKAPAQCREQVRKWLSHPEVKAASKEMERPSFLFWVLWAVYRFHLASFLLTGFEIQKFFKERRELG